MFRACVRQGLFRYYHTTSPFEIMVPQKIEPKDWRIIETSPSGLELTFINDKTRESTWYTPEGMTAADILAIPGATKYWDSIEDVQQYIEKMVEDKARYGGEDIDSANQFLTQNFRGKECRTPSTIIGQTS